jgi:tetratricopeptide (TPR) repeat protein
MKKLTTYKETSMKKRFINHGVAIIVITVLTFLATTCVSIPPAAIKANDRGVDAYQAGNYDKAITEFTAAIRLYHDYALAYSNRGFAYSRKGDFDRAITDYDQAIKLQPTALRYNRRGWTYYLKGDWDRAIIDAAEAIRLDSKNANAYDTRGAAYREKGDYDRAIADFDQALRLNSKLTASYDGRGLTYHYKGDYNRAIADYESALRLDPNRVDVKRNLELARQRQAPSVAQSGGQSAQTQPNGGGQNTPAPVTPIQQIASPYFTGTGGRGISLGIIVPESQGLSADLAYIPAMVQGVLVSNFSKYSGILVLDRVSLDRVIAETLDPTYADNLDIVRLGHIAQVGNMLTGKITRTSSGYTLQLNVTETTPNARTVAAYSGTCTVAQLDNHTAIQTAVRELLTQMGVALTDRAIADLGTAGTQQAIAAQAALARGITVEKQGNQNAAFDYYTQATTLDPALPEAAIRFSALADRVQGSRLAEKLDWLRAFAQTGGSYLFEISADETIGDQNLTFSGKNNITLTLRGRSANRTIRISDRYGSISVGSGVTLVLDNNITLQKGVRVNSDGTLIMNTGSMVTGGYVTVIGTYIMNGGKISGINDGGGGVVHVYGGTFTMNGGEISGNNIIYGAVQSGEYGGAVNVSGGTFTMNSGEISRNTASLGYNSNGGNGSGVNVFRGTFTMNGGKILGNTAYRNGGGVYVNTNGTFTMTGGEISGNSARQSYEGGGGVYVVKGATFAMRGGTIIGNTAVSGGGVYMGYDDRTELGGTFTMSGGTISSNTASRNGGGVYVSGTFTMSNGTISGNNAREYGGGVYVQRSGTTFTKTGGTITGYASDTANGNAVRSGSEAINFRGHTVYAGSPDTLLKIKEGTVGPGDNMSYNGTRNPPTASGAWDN